MSDFTPMPIDDASKPSSDPDIVLDLRGTPCPINFVRTKLKLQQMEIGKLLEVWIDPGEPVEQVPDSLRMDGYEIEQLTNQGDYYALQVWNSET